MSCAACEMLVLLNQMIDKKHQSLQKLINTYESQVHVFINLYTVWC